MEQTQVNRVENPGKRKHEVNTKYLEFIRCGNIHYPSDTRRSPALNVKCHQCGRIGHFARRCKSAKGNRPNYPNTSNFRLNNKTEKRKRVRLFKGGADSDVSPSTSGRSNFEYFRIDNTTIPSDISRDEIINVKIMAQMSHRQ